MAHPLLLCPVCGDDVPPGAACPRCGHAELRERPALCLPVGTVLHGEYTVGNPLGKPGGFGITYFAWYRALEQAVAIKEYLPTNLAGRSPDSRTVKSHSLDHEADFRFGIEQFLREARTLARLHHPNIVRIRGFFEENGTAYLVMDYYPGRSFDRLLAERGGRLPEREAVGLLLPILDALQHLHRKNLLHRDVKPTNLYLAEDGTPLLLDFGAARSVLGERTQSASLVHTPGFAPFEQYIAGGEQGPWTDVYAAAATLYKLLTGVVPPNALERTSKDALVPPERLVPGLSPNCSRAMLAGLALQAEKRPREAKDLRKLLVMEPMAASSQPSQAPQQDPPPTPAPRLRIERSRHWSWRSLWVTAVVVALAVTLTVWRPWDTTEEVSALPDVKINRHPVRKAPDSAGALIGQDQARQEVSISPGVDVAPRPAQESLSPAGALIGKARDRKEVSASPGVDIAPRPAQETLSPAGALTGKGQDQERVSASPSTETSRRLAQEIPGPAGALLGKDQGQSNDSRDEAIRIARYDPSQGYVAQIEEMKVIPAHVKPSQTASLYVRYLVIGPDPREDVTVQTFRGIKYNQKYVVGAGPNKFTVPQGGGIVESTSSITFPAEAPEGVYTVEFLLEDSQGRFAETVGSLLMTVDSP